MKAKSILMCLMLALLTACSNDDIPQIEPINSISEQTFFEKTSNKSYSFQYGTYLLLKNNNWKETPSYKLGLDETASMRPDYICKFAIPSHLCVDNNRLYADNILIIDFNDYEMSNAEYELLKDYYIYYDTALNIDSENNFILNSTYFAMIRAKGYNLVIEDVNEEEFSLRLEMPKNQKEFKFDALRLKYQVKEETYDNMFFFDSQEEAAEYVRAIIKENV